MKKKLIIFTSEHCWKYNIAGHPEAPFRVKDTYEYLRKKQTELNIDIVSVNNEIDEDILLLTHTKSLIESVKSGNFYDPDTPNFENVIFYAKVSANVVLEALKASLQEKIAFALTRPPGHHAGSSSLGGFCYFNNIACAVNWYLSNDLENKKVAILDIDVHHGNGTQEIFLGNDKVLFISIHQAYIYPGSGLKSEKNCLNFPLFAGTDDFEYLKILDEAIQEIKEFSPNLLAISCGFDTFKEEPLAGLNLSENCYYEIGKKIAKVGIPTFFALEGGYSKKLPYLIENFLKGLIES
ncbi:MAG: histone deacetylase [Elusimicrobiota bacterium]|nr:histone deacetylase [Endomicrobiia bacterium]MDW8166650.1 histone deacetylase [Elusimicrobiota bacterium]